MSAEQLQEEGVEKFDPAFELDAKLTLLAQWVREAKRLVIFTGAGISTSAGIADLRSGMNTVVETGPGVLTVRSAATKELLEGSHPVKPELQRRNSLRTSPLAAIPTVSHMALVELANRGIVKYIISQNTDGLHRRSGIPAEMLSELHGNTNIEVCDGCGKQYYRDFRVRVSKDPHDHLTGRVCSNGKCQGKLKDSIVNIAEHAPEAAYNLALANIVEADLCLSLGSSLHVMPGAELPERVWRAGHRLAVVNLQPTRLDQFALKLNAKCDDVMKKLMDKLAIAIPPFVLTRYLRVTSAVKVVNKTRHIRIEVEGVERDGSPASVLRAVSIVYGDQEYFMEKEPFVAEWPLKSSSEFQLPLSIHARFMGHFSEPDVSFSHSQPVPKVGHSAARLLQMGYSPDLVKWSEPVTCEPSIGEKPCRPAHTRRLSDMVEDLAKMGFDEHRAREVLMDSDRNFDTATEVLLAENDVSTLNEYDAC